LILTVLLLLFDSLCFKNDLNVTLKSNKQKNYFLNEFLVGLLKVNDENRRIRNRFRIQIHQSKAWGSADPNPHQMSWIRNVAYENLFLLKIIHLWKRQIVSPSKQTEDIWFYKWEAKTAKLKRIVENTVCYIITTEYLAYKTTV
jgi:hypothetical protein